MEKLSLILRISIVDCSDLILLKDNNVQTSSLQYNVSIQKISNESSELIIMKSFENIFILKNLKIF
jgi:hypothetical protein